MSKSFHVQIHGLNRKDIERHLGTWWLGNSLGCTDGFSDMASGRYTSGVRGRSHRFQKVQRGMRRNRQGMGRSRNWKHRRV